VGQPTDSIARPCAEPAGCRARLVCGRRVFKRIMRQQVYRISSATSEARKAADEMDRWLACRVAEHEADGISKVEAIAMAMKEILYDDEIEEVQDWFKSQIKNYH